VPHSEKQERFIFSEKRITLAATGIQWGKGLPLDAKVLTDAGYRNAGDIWPGDILYDRDGSPTTVLSVFPQGMQRCFQINFTDSKSLITDGAHLNVLQRLCCSQEFIMSTLELFHSLSLWGGISVPCLNIPNKVIASLVEVESRETVCFKVDSPSATFIANDQIVTHNSEGGAVRMARKIHQHTRKSDTFIVAAPTFGIMQQATLPTFLEFCGEFGEYHKGDKVFETYWGSIVYFRTGTIGNSVVGIRNCRHIWLDEGGMCSLYFWENLQGRAAPKQATIDITTSPYSMNWVYKELIKPTLDGRRDDVELVQAISKENPYFAQEEYDLRKKTMDPRRFNMMFGGEWGRREGIVYNCFDDVENQIEMSALPEGLRYFAGIDWGYTQEFSLVVIACTDDEVFVVANVKRSQLLISAIKDLVSQFQRLLNIELFICGPDQPGYIRELNTVSNVKATTAINDVMPGIGVVYEMLAGRKLRFVAGKCQYLLDEVEQYHYPAPRDLGVDKDEKEQNPVKANDHSLDALRYVVVTTRNLLKVRGPFTPDVLASAKQDQRQRIKGLLNSHKKSRTEQWA